MALERLDQHDGLGYTEDRQSDSIIFVFTYDPAAPFDKAQLEQAVSLILTIPDVRDLLFNQNFIAYLEGTFRIGPYSDEEAKEAVEVLLETWNERLVARAIEQSKVDEELRIKNKRMNPPLGNRTPAVVPGTSSGVDRSSPPQQGQVATARSIEGLLSIVDESKFAYSAWLMRENPPERLLAAAQYIDHFDILKLTLADDPALDNVARLDAFRLLYRGGTLNVYAAKRFLDSLRRQTEAEGWTWRGQGLNAQAAQSQAVEPAASANIRGQDSDEDGLQLEDYDSKDEEEDDSSE